MKPLRQIWLGESFAIASSLWNNNHPVKTTRVHAYIAIQYISFHSLASHAELSAMEKLASCKNLANDFISHKIF